MNFKESNTWFRKITIDDSKKHSKGFTIYKITSNIFPRHSPEACTSTTVWKRFNEIYKLYQLLKGRHSSLGIKDPFPTLSRGTYFNRFDPEVIENRKKDILTFLTYVSKYTRLFTAQCFVQFFETSQISDENECGNIAVIRCSLSLPKEDDLLSIKSLCNESENNSASSSTSHSECSNISCIDTENVDAKNNVSYINNENQPPLLSNKSPSNSICDNLLEEDLLSLNESHKGDTDYIFEAAYHFSKAVHCEDAKQYNIAAELYKVGINCLETGIKSDSDRERSALIQFKINKYKDHEKLLHSIISNDICEQKNEEITSSTYLTRKSKLISLERPLEELHYFHVLHVINTVLQVSDTRTKTLCIIKTIRKNLNDDSLVENIFPHNIPYMVPLINYFQSETTIYLLLKHVSGGRLCDRIDNFVLNLNKSKFENAGNTIDYNRILSESQIMKHVSKKDVMFSDFIENYKKIEKVEISETSDNAFTENELKLRINNNDFDEDEHIEIKDKIDDLNTEKILQNSEQLLKSVSETLLSNTKVKSSDKPNHTNIKTEFESGPSGSSKQQDFSSAVEDIEKLNIIPQTLLAEWAAELLLAIDHLHNWGVLCGPILPDDILLGEKGQLVLTYRGSSAFNLQKLRVQDADKLIAPELINPLVKPTEKHDWWYYGVAIYHLFTGVSLQHLHPHGFNNFTILQFPSHVSDEASSLLISLLQGDASERLGCGQTGVNEIKTHPFFIRIDWRKLEQSFTYLEN